MSGYKFAGEFMKIIAEKIDELAKCRNDTFVCHSRGSGNPLFQILTSFWIPPFAGMTTFYDSIEINFLNK